VLTFFWCSIFIIVTALYFKRPWYVFFTSAAMAGVGIGVNMYFGIYLNGGGIIHVICVGVIAVVLFYFIKAIRGPRNGS